MTALRLRTADLPLRRGATVPCLGARSGAEVRVFADRGLFGVEPVVGVPQGGRLAVEANDRLPVSPEEDRDCTLAAADVEDVRAHYLRAHPVDACARARLKLRISRRPLVDIAHAVVVHVLLPVRRGIQANW